MSNKEELSRVEQLLKSAHDTKQYSKMSNYEDRISKLKLIVKIEKLINKELPLFKFDDYWIDYIESLGFKGKPNEYGKFALHLGVPEEYVSIRKNKK